MTEQSGQEEQDKTMASPSFLKRFNIKLDLEEARNIFISRTLNLVEVFNPGLQTTWRSRKAKDDRILQLIATELGIRYEREHRFSSYVEGDFIKLLRALEAAYKVLKIFEEETALDVLVIQESLSKSELDLGIQWREGVFWPSGAKLLDEALVNENLKWLSDPKYADVLTPFEKGLQHFLEAQKQPEKLSDTITDMYEAMEKMARIINGNNRTLGSNANQFIGNLGLSDHYETMLREYTKYAHEFRHAVEQGKERVPPLPNEVEAFVYTTGLFIRLAIQQANQ